MDSTYNVCFNVLLAIFDCLCFITCLHHFIGEYFDMQIHFSGDLKYTYYFIAFQYIVISTNISYKLTGIWISFFITIYLMLIIRFSNLRNVIYNIALIAISVLFLFVINVSYILFSILHNGYILNISYRAIFLIFIIVIQYHTSKNKVQLVYKTPAKKLLSHFILISTVLNLICIFIAIPRLSMKDLFHFVMVVLLQWLMWIVIKQIINFRKKEEENHREYVFTNQLEALNDCTESLRREKHEFKNMLSIVKLLCNEKPDIAINQILIYVNQVLDNINIEYQHEFNTGSTLINGLLARLKHEMLDNSIHLQIEIEHQLDFSLIDEFRLYAVISNVLRNAVDAFKDSEPQDYKVVNVYFFEENNTAFISISNNGPMITIRPIELVFQSGYTTKENNRYEHGYGLYITKKILKTLGG